MSYLRLFFLYIYILFFSFVFFIPPFLNVHAERTTTSYHIGSTLSSYRLLLYYDFSSFFSLLLLFDFKAAQHSEAQRSSIILHHKFEFQRKIVCGLTSTKANYKKAARTLALLSIRPGNQSTKLRHNKRFVKFFISLSFFFGSTTVKILFPFILKTKKNYIQQKNNSPCC